MKIGLSKKLYPDGDDFRVALSLALVADSHWELLNISARSDEWTHMINFVVYLQELRRFRQGLQIPFEPSETLPIDLSALVGLGNWVKFSLPAGKTCDSRKFFLLQNGYFGLGPAIMKPGDVVGVVLGASVPFILRRYGECYKVVGECYAHGLMGGEAVRMWKKGDLSADDIRL